jgi:hypothetical protein
LTGNAKKLSGCGGSASTKNDERCSKGFFKLRREREDKEIQMLNRSFIVGCSLMAVSMVPAFSIAEIVMSQEQALQSIRLLNVTVQNEIVSGEIVNISPWPLRDVELLVQHRWHWTNEFRPGENNPGMAVFYKVEREIPPGGSVPFTYGQPSPSSTPDVAGQFETVVSVVGFEQIMRQ